LPEFDSYQFVPDSNWPGQILTAFFQQDCKEPLPRVACEYASFCNVTHNRRAHIWVRSPTLENHSLVQTKPINLRIDFPISDLSRRLEKGWRGRPARERGQMRTPLSYSPQPHRARAIATDFCTGGHGCWNCSAIWPPEMEVDFRPSLAGLAKKFRAGEMDSYYAYASDILNGVLSGLI
jgi:hypothetical protein